MKKKGFTLVELLVVIAIIAMLLAILMPALGKVRQLAQRIMCGTNLGGIGKAMLTYATDDKYESFPIGGGGGAFWDYGKTVGEEGKCSWAWDNRNEIPPGKTVTPPCSTSTCTSTLSACLYLLVKYAGMSTDQFICPGGSEKEFELSIYTLTSTPKAKVITDVWDFGSGEAVASGSRVRGRGHNSYSYQLPLPTSDLLPDDKCYPITAASNPALPVMADRNPYWDAINTDILPMEWDTNKRDIKPNTVLYGNTLVHQKEGQNVAFADQHVKFEKASDCGIEGDNIYLTWEKSALDISVSVDEQALHGILPGSVYQCQARPKPPQNSEDSWLINDFN